MRRTSSLQVVAALLAVNLRRLARDSTSMIFLVAVPFLLILLIGLANPGGQESSGRPVGLVAPAEPDGPAARLIAALDDAPALRPTRYGDVDAMTSAVRRRVQAAGIEIPPDLTARLDAGQDAEVRFHTDPSAMPPLTVRTAVAQVVARAGATLRSARVVAERTGISTEAALVAAYGLPADRARGLTRRTFAAPTSSAAILLGEGLYRLVVALLQAGLIVMAGALLFGVHWGDPAAVTAIVLLFALASTGASILLGSLVRTPELVTGITPPLGIGLGMLGGCLWPLEAVGPTMRTIGHATPHAWAVDAFTEVVGAGAGPSDIATELGALAAFAAGFLAIALVVFARTSRSARG